MTSTGNISDISQRQKAKCPVCGSREIRPSDGWVVCTNCGTCQDREIVQGTFTIRENQFLGPSQSVDIGNKIHVANAQGSLIGHQSERQSILMTSKVLRLRRAHNQTMMRIEQRMIQGFKLINKTAVHLHLPEQTRDRAAYLLRKTLPHYPTKSQHPLVVCVLVLAIREHQLPLTEDDVLEIILTRLRHKGQLNRAKFFIMEQLGIKWPILRPELFIPKVISAIRKNPKVLRCLKRRNGTPDYFNRLERLSINLLQSMTSNDYGARSPEILAASAVYTIDRLLLHVVSQEDAGETVGVVDHSIRAHHNGFWKHKSDQIEELLEVAE